jgi:hypothetical protein
MGWASRKTLANFWRGVKVLEAVDVAAAIVGSLVVGGVIGLPARDLQD